MNEPVLIRLLDISTATNYNLELGFSPHHVRVLVCDTAPIIYEWWGKIMNDSLLAIAGSWEFGTKFVGGSSATYMADAETGISAFDGSKTPQVLIADPSTGDLTKTTLGVKTAVAGVRNVDYNPLTDYNTYGVNRSSTLIGTIIRPTTHNGCVYELHTKSSGAAGTEPDWGTVPGETTTDPSDNIWICREENIVASKGLGITLGYTLLEDGKEVYVIAERFNRYEDIGAIVYD